MKAWLAASVAAFALLACQGNAGDPRSLLLEYGTYAASPVVLLDVQINGQPVPMSPVIFTLADQETPRASYSHLLSFPPAPAPGTVTVSVTWVELLTDQAWQAEVTAPLAAFDRDTTIDQIRMAPVFGPNGLMILISDPVPTSATNIPQVDVARVCGTRQPAADFDYTADPGELGLTELLQFDFPAVTSPECPAQD